MTATKKTRAPRAPSKNGTLQSDTREEMLKLYSGISLSFHWWGMMRSVSRNANSKAAEANGMAEEATYTQKLLLDRKLEEWRDINRLKGAISGWFQARTLPYVIEGVRLFRVEMRDELLSMAGQWQKDLLIYASRMNAARPKIVEWARKNLSGEFNEGLYPKDFTQSFTITVREHSIDPPAYLRTRDDETFRAAMNRALDDMRQGMARYEQECLRQIGGGIGTLTTALVENNGIREATVENMRQKFAQIVQMRYDGTASFKACMSEAEELVNGLSLTDLRRSHEAKTEAREKLMRLMARYKELREAAQKKAQQTSTTTEQA